MTDMTMTCAELDVRFADYLTDALSAAERAAVDAHLAGCARCAGVLAALDERPAASPKLPVLAPKHDLWSAIAARIEPRVLTLGGRPARRSVPLRWRAAQLLGAAALLVASTAVVTRLVVLRDQSTAPAGVAVNPITPGGLVPVANRHEQLIRTYDEEIAQLDSAVRERRGQLDTTTVKIIEKNLRVIDKAIDESRAALAKDPKSHFLNEQLTRVLDQKVGLLRTAALLPART
jgi:hypothetical protein